MASTVCKKLDKLAYCYSRVRTHEGILKFHDFPYPLRWLNSFFHGLILTSIFQKVSRTALGWKISCTKPNFNEDIQALVWRNEPTKAKTNIESHQRRNEVNCLPGRESGKCRLPPPPPKKKNKKSKDKRRLKKQACRKNILSKNGIFFLHCVH